MKRAAAVLGLALLAGCGGTGTTATKAPPSPSPADTSPADVSPSPLDSPSPQGATEFAMGDTASITSNGSPAGTITVTGPQINRTAVEQYGQAPRNGYYLTFTVAANATAAAFTINPYDFYVREPDGTHIDQSSGNIATVGSALSVVSLNAGEKVRGTITLDAPSPHGELVYAPGLSAIGQWRF